MLRVSSAKLTFCEKQTLAQDARQVTSNLVRLGIVVSATEQDMIESRRIREHQPIVLRARAGQILSAAKASDRDSPHTKTLQLTPKMPLYLTAGPKVLIHSV